LASGEYFLKERERAARKKEQRKVRLIFIASCHLLVDIKTSTESFPCAEFVQKQCRKQELTRPVHASEMRIVVNKIMKVPS